MRDDDDTMRDEEYQAKKRNHRGQYKRKRSVRKKSSFRHRRRLT
jgi:hypothetical protein